MLSQLINNGFFLFFR